MDVVCAPVTLALWVARARALQGPSLDNLVTYRLCFKIKFLKSGWGSS